MAHTAISTVSQMDKQNKSVGITGLVLC